MISIFSSLTSIFGSTPTNHRFIPSSQQAWEVWEMDIAHEVGEKAPAGGSQIGWRSVGPASPSGREIRADRGPWTVWAGRHQGARVSDSGGLDFCLGWSLRAHPPALPVAGHLASRSPLPGTVGTQWLCRAVPCRGERLRHRTQSPRSRSGSGALPRKLRTWWPEPLLCWLFLQLFFEALPWKAAALCSAGFRPSLICGVTAQTADFRPALCPSARPGGSRALAPFISLHRRSETWWEEACAGAGLALSAGDSSCDTGRVSHLFSYTQVFFFKK